MLPAGSSRTTEVIDYSFVESLIEARVKHFSGLANQADGERTDGTDPQ